MNKIEINPSLFITCRLCLEDLGVYQIVPVVKEQILFCFDINVEPFDGLPQLICKKCEAILSNFTETKKKFTEKQNDLMNKKQESQNGQLPQPKKVDSMENIVFESNDEIINVSRRRKLCISSSSSDFELVKSVRENIENDKGSDTYKEIGLSWPSSYVKEYVCRFCNRRCSSTKELKTHINSRHSVLKKKYSNIFKRHCEVNLLKIDDKVNITGSKNKVMYAREKIIQNINPRYYVIYTTNRDNDMRSSPQKKEVNYNSKRKTRKSSVNSDSSDDQIIVKRKRSRRFCSRSSNETVVLDTANKSNVSDNSKESSKISPTVELGECINIDDSSDSESDNVKGISKTKPQQNYTFELKKEDLKPDEATINNITTSCKIKYAKKHHNDNFMLKSNKNPTEIATQLKRKILSIGRKLINKKKGINCTPLLRFMEHKNLEIAWIPRSIANVNQDSNYIRIMARTKNIEEKVCSDTGWTDYTLPSNLSNGQIFSVVTNTSLEENLSSEHKLPNGIDSSEVPCESISEIAISDSAVLMADANLTGTDTKKLLNANPVANPKQLPKKTINETKTPKQTAGKQVVSTIEVPSVQNNDNEIDMCLPIITSTTSLAMPFTVSDNNDSSSSQREEANSKNNDVKTDTPRIKVKPPSELMTAETLNRMKEPVLMPCIVTTTNQLPLQTENNYINIYVPPMNTVSQFQNNVQSNNTCATSFSSPDPSWKSDYMILDTTEMPNTTTNSPFQYFRRLLQLHNITLLDTDVDLSSEFHCLIKFKVLYKQESNNQPVILCLSLFCAQSIFCLKIKDRNQENINISRISPNWQWEVLKIYKGEVVNKLLTNAQKVSRDVYEFTNSFLCLLKSIKLIKS